MSVLVNFVIREISEFANPNIMKHISVFLLNVFIVLSLFSQDALTPNPEALIKEADSLLKKDD